MAVMTRHEPGMFCWADLATSDQEGSRRFYCELMGWTFEDMPMGEGQSYTMLYKDGQTVAALYAQMPDQKGMPPTWSNYVAVESADATARKAASLGGRIVLPPDDVFDSGRMAFIEDPTGAVLGLWQPRAHIGAGRYGEDGALVWAELLTRDTAAAERFYTGLFGWTTEPMPMPGGPPYTVFNSGKNGAGGMMQMPAEMKDVPPFWMVYFAAKDTAATVERVRELGGRVSSGPQHIPGAGVIATVADPQGGTFSLIQPES